LNNLFEAGRVEEVKGRMAQLRPDSERLWGKMNAAQALAHCCSAVEWAVGDRIPPRMFLGRVMGRIVKPLVLGNDQPMRRNSPTAKDLVVRDERDLEAERGGLRGLSCLFPASRPKGSRTHPHTSFGRLPPEPRATLMYKN